MKAKLLRVLLLLAIIFTLNSCSSDSSEAAPSESSNQKVMNYTYNSSELEAMNIINKYRESVGLLPLQQINHVSFKSEEHDDYMINNNVVNHNNFVERSENIISVLRAKRVGENVAYNYNTPQSAVTAWLNSPSHKENIVGDYTHFGIAIKTNAQGKKYYTNIFVKI
jgi:uncharacterized protein YkwD